MIITYADAERWLKSHSGGSTCVICGDPRDRNVWCCVTHREEWHAALWTLIKPNYAAWAFQKRMILLLERISGLR